MVNNVVLGGKVASMGWGGEDGWRRASGSGSDDVSDEEYVLGRDGEEEAESSNDSYSSDASRKGSQCADEAEEKEEEFDLVGKVEITVFKGRRTRRQRAMGDFVAAEVEMEAPPMRKLQVTQRWRPTIPTGEEGDKCDDFDDEDFAPDEDEDNEEEIARVPVRKAGCGRSKPMKLQRRRGRPKNSIMGEKRMKAPATKKKKMDEWDGTRGWDGKRENEEEKWDREGRTKGSHPRKGETRNGGARHPMRITVHSLLIPSFHHVFHRNPREDFKEE